MYDILSLPFNGNMVHCFSCIMYNIFLPDIFSDQAQGVSAWGVAGGVAATAILALCCIVFAAVYLHKRKQPAPNVHKTRYGLISHLNPGQYTRMLTISLFYSGVV